MAKKTTTVDKQEESTQPTQITKTPLVFISHDTRDADLAEAFSQLLSNSSMGILQSFRSSDKKGTQGIEYGTLWYEEIFKKLNEASDVVCLLTHHSIDRPWILYEAGIAIGKSGTPLIGIALGLPLSMANSGPFAQFQNCADDVDSLTKLVSNLVSKIPNARPIEEVIKGQVNQFLEKVAPIVKKQSKSESKDLSEDTPVAKLFEEIKIMFQDLPGRIEKNISNSSPNKKFRRLHPMMLEELAMISQDDGVGFLMILSMLKHDFPWIYDIGSEALKKIKSSKSIKDKEIASRNFFRVLNVSLNHPIMNDLAHKQDYSLYREMLQMLEMSLDRLIRVDSKDPF
ncbi:TIR domain-containing protein [Chitinophaga sp. 30R24]|uniref:TIR domain-containing protein n=1 Tax=Chitinophaga sp. 30R24 TaxID=3248838 RepID=UPI003B9045F1